MPTFTDKTIAITEAWIEEAVGKLGPLDGCANLAGVVGKQGGKATVSQIDDQDWDFVFGVNIKGVLNCMRAQISALRDGGAIVNAALVAGLMGIPMNGAYVASKHAVMGLTKTAARDYGHRGVRVNVICPGPTDTGMWQSYENTDALLQQLALKRVGQPSEVAALVAFLLGDDSKFITGSSYSIDGGSMC